MYDLIKQFPQQVREAIEIGAAAELELNSQNIHNIVVLGLGGSAFGGEIVKDYSFDKIKSPINILRGYTLPGYVGPGSLVIASSYSGNTEETLTTSTEALKRGAQLVCVTSGGQLADWAEANNIPLIRIPGGRPPRASCGYSLVQQLFVLHAAGQLPDFKADLEEALAVLETFADENETKALAQKLTDRAIAIYSSDAAESAAIRWRQQINENSKQLCWHHVVPEMNHNELVGWELPKFITQKSVALLLRTDYDHVRVRLRWDINSQILQQRGAEIVNIQAKGKSKLAQLIYLLHYGDLLSWYLAEINGVAATPVDVINYLKGELAKIN